MTEKEELIQKFYTAFANNDAKTMCECYHPNIQFEDPAFGKLIGRDACRMWQMLLERSKGNIKIEFSDIEANEYLGSAKWVATYNFSKTNRQVVNRIFAQFQFADGLIIKHNDSFDIWKWSKQAFGFKGYLLGWTGYMQKEIQKQAKISLEKYNKTDI